MAKRGRPPRPIAERALLGNPGKRRMPKPVNIQMQPPSVPAVTSEPLRDTLRPEAPNYLTEVDELFAFEEAIKALPPGLVRAVDQHTLARWAYWLATWTRSKRILEGRAHWTEANTKQQGQILREHPIAKRMQQAEENCVRLEDRLGMNPATRHAIMSRLFALPTTAGMPPPMPVPTEAEQQAPPAAPPDDNPLGFIARAGKLH